MKSLAGVFALVVATSAGCASMPVTPATHSTERELKLGAGPFRVLPGLALGDAIKFENDIYSATCYPLFAVSGQSQTASAARATGTILLWINRAHAADGRVFVDVCEPAAPFAASSTQIDGAVSDEWFEMTLVPESGHSRVSLRRLDVSGWGEFSAPAFCGHQVAFWSLGTGGELTGHVADLFDPRRRSSSPVAKIVIAGGDMGWGVAAGRWSADCSGATFETTSGVTKVLTLTPRR